MQICTVEAYSQLLQNPTDAKLGFHKSPGVFLQGLSTVSCRQLLQGAKAAYYWIMKYPELAGTHKDHWV